MPILIDDDLRFEDEGARPRPAMDPYFNATMARVDLYRYGTQHYDHHRKQLTLATLTTHTATAS